MTALEQARREARLRTIRIISEEGSLRFQPAVYCERDLRPKRTMTWDRVGRRGTR